MTPPNIVNLRKEFDSDLKNSNDLSSVEALRIKYLGRNGIISSLMESMKDLPNEEKPAFGKSVNDLKKYFTAKYDTALKNANSENKSRPLPGFDHTLPGVELPLGRKHPLTRVWEEMLDIFTRMGFEVVRGPEVETEYYNFSALNFPDNHPARDMQDTLYITDDTMLRTHTSPVQIRIMQSSTPPVRVIIPGRVYRNEAISARSYCVFNQIE